MRHLGVVTMCFIKLVGLANTHINGEGLAETTSGERVVAAALKRAPSMTGYVEQLRNRTRGVAGTEAGLKSEIERAFRELRVPAGGRLDSTSAHPGPHRS